MPWYMKILKAIFGLSEDQERFPPSGPVRPYTGRHGGGNKPKPK